MQNTTFNQETTEVKEECSMEMKYNDNLYKLQAYMNEVGTIEKLEEKISQISPESRKALETYWGLIGEAKPCRQYTRLQKKYGISKEDVKLAHDEILARQHMKLLVDADDFDWQEATHLALIATKILSEEYHIEKTVRGIEVKNFLQENLTDTELLVMRMLYSAHRHTLDDVCNKLQTSFEEVRKIEAKAIRKFKSKDLNKLISLTYAERCGLKDIEMQKNPAKYVPITALEIESNVHSLYCRIRCADVEYISELAELSPIELADKAGINLILANEIIEKAKSFDYESYFLKLMENSQYFIEDLNLSIRTYNCLFRGNITTVNAFLKLTPEQVCNIRWLGKKSYEEVAKKREELGVPLE